MPGPGLSAARWSFAALGLWAGRVLMVLLVAAGLEIGPLAADQAWDRGIHVTPAQAALHDDFMAAGFTHHHMRAQSAAPAAHGPENSTAVEPGMSGSSWGTPVTPSVQPALAGCGGWLHCALAAMDELVPHSVPAAPPTPPPQQAA